MYVSWRGCLFPTERVLWNSLNLLELCVKDEQASSSVESPAECMLVLCLHLLSVHSLTSSHYAFGPSRSCLAISLLSQWQVTFSQFTHAHHLPSSTRPNSCSPFAQFSICSLIHSTPPLFTYARSSSIQSALLAPLPVCSFMPAHHWPADHVFAHSCSPIHSLALHSAAHVPDEHDEVIRQNERRRAYWWTSFAEVCSLLISAWRSCLVLGGYWLWLVAEMWEAMAKR